tara:strand:+ start:343 stop:1329 length:987 start_codon:yes stop_codon:yes gene_type:complete
MNTNLLLVSPYSMKHYGGVQNQLILFKKYLSSKNFNVKILSPDSPDFNVGEAINLPFNGSIAPVKLTATKDSIKKAYDWADIVHVHEPFIPYFFWGIKINNRTIVTHHADLSKPFAFFQKIFLRNEKYAHAVTAVSRVAKKGIGNSISTTIVPNTIELNNETDNLTTSSINLLFIGRDEKRKNFSLFKRFANEYSNKTYNFVAITNNTKSVQNITVHTNPDENTKSKILNNSTIYIAPNTHGESFGITLLEAINSDCVVVCSDIDAFKELLGDSGVYFTNNSLDSLTKIVDSLLKENTMEVLSKQKKYIEKYNIDKVMSSWISLYSQI